MGVANQAYHYNFGLTLTASREDLRPVTVDTEIGKAFDPMLKTQEAHSGELEELVDLPIMSLPRTFPFDHGDLLRPLVDPSSKAYAAKRRYIGSLDDLFAAGKSAGEQKKALNEASRDYQAALIHLLGPTFGKVNLGAIFPDNSFSVTFGLVGDLQSHPVATEAHLGGLAVNIMNEVSGNARSEVGRQFLKKRFRLAPIDAKEHERDNYVFRIRDLRPHVAALAFDENAAEEHCQALQTY
jgi:hypothetical protein